MFTVTEAANAKIKEFLQGRSEPLNIRILMTSGCGGPNLGMSLDESRDTDEVFEDNGLVFLVEKDLLNDVKPITVDYVTSPRGEGFQISSSFVPPAGGGGCSSCSGCH